MNKQFDIGIIGAGPAGYTAALHASSKGLSVVMFEKDKTGGVCLNRGCIPTKAILHSAQIYEEIKCAEKLGIVVENSHVDFSKVIERKDKTVEKLRKSLELVLKNSGVVTLNSEAIIIDKNTILANDEEYNCKKIICAAGSLPREIPNIKFDHRFILSSDDVLNLTDLPESILIIGSGAIGVEWARIFSAFGVKVFVVEMAEHLLPVADIEVSKRIERIFKSKKIEFYTSDSVEKIEDKQVYLKSGTLLEPEYIMLAVGRQPVTYEKIDGVIYIGDICGKIQLAHFGIKQAVSEIDGVRFDENLVPSVVYGNPEIAWIGAREQDLEQGTFEKVNLLVSALGKSHCDDSVEGFIKILSREGQIIGAHIVSKEASALIQQIAIAMQNKVSIDKLKEVCFAHPTYSEGIFECLFKLQA